jgi:ABC-type sugar transport system ATPase subunit
MSSPLIQLSGIGKSFGPTRVLEGVALELRAGEVHLLAGENGAGKSTLIKILAGIYPDYEGEIRLAGRPVRFGSPQEANRHGIAVIHQEMSLIDDLSVLDNIFLGRESTQLGGWWLDRAALLPRALEICRQLDLDFTADDLARPVAEFSLSTKNRIEIAKALSQDARVIVMDEPTSALSRPEVEKLFGLIAALRARGCGILYISHKMEEIYRIADRITVLRDGRLAGTAPAAECPQPKLIQWMIGRELTGHFPPRPRPSADAPVAFAVERFTVPPVQRGRPPRVREVSLKVRRGEIVGLAGLQGSGAAELLHGLFGVYGPVCTGRVVLGGREFSPGDPRAAIARRLALLTGDRKGTGLVLGRSVGENITLAALPRYSPGGLLRPRREHAAAQQDAAALRIKLASTDQPAGSLSGGNQQKVVLAKWRQIEPEVLLLEEPTRGVDIGAKHEIYALMNQWTAQGMAIVLISTEMPELLGLCDRIVVLHRGGVTAELERSEATAERILAAAMGVPPAPAQN